VKLADREMRVTYPFHRPVFKCDSDIIANAVKGKGGNIQINTQSIFGLKYRDQFTPNNDITASSQFGINGNVQVQR
jgi:large exoprotein involved in heme utilization and adhesion